jgi:mycothiol synthase
LIIVRNFRPDDLGAYVQLVNEIDRADRLGKATSVEQMRERLGRQGYYPQEDLCFAGLAGSLVGYAEIRRELEIGRVILDGAVRPAHRRQGVGSRLLETVVERSRKLGAKVIHTPIVQRVPAGESFVHKRGFRRVRRQWQMSLTGYGKRPHQLPPDFELGHFMPGDEESLCALQNLAFTGSWGFRPNTVEEIGYLVNTSGFDPAGVLFITEGQRKIAYCWTAAHPAEKDKGYIRMMGVAPACRRRGLGRAVLTAAVEYLNQRGIKEIELVVDSGNSSARHLYQSLGFQRKDTILWYERRLSPD